MKLATGGAPTFGGPPLAPTITAAGTLRTS
jgi:hypothetical protein